MLQKTQEREHPASAAFLGAIGIVTREVAGRADSGIEDRIDPQIAALPNDVGCEIDFIVRWPNTRAELNNEIGWTRTELSRHRFDCVWDDAEFRSFLAGMDETDRATNRIDEINRAAIGDVNAQTKSRLVRNDSVAICETFVRRERDIHDGNLFPVDLLCGNERRRAKFFFSANLSVNRVEPGQSLGFVVRHFDAGNAKRETVDDLRQRA